jgi:carboxylesterase
MKTVHVLIHGFAGSPLELEYLHKYLKENELDVVSIILKGHDNDKKEFAQTSHIDWIQSAEVAIEELKSRYDCINLIGFSMGGLIAANLYQKFKIDKMVFVNTPIYYWDIKKIMFNIYDDFKNKDFKNLKRYLTVSTDKPFMSLLYFLILLNKSKRLFSHIQCETLILQSKNDDTVRAKSAEFILDAVQGKKHRKYYEGGSHQIFESEISADVSGDILAFLR